MTVEWKQTKSSVLVPFDFSRSAEDALKVARNFVAKPDHVTVLHVIALAQYAATYTRGRAAESVNARVRLKAEWDRANQESLLLRKEIRIKDARLARIDPHRRPH